MTKKNNRTVFYDKKYIRTEITDNNDKIILYGHSRKLSPRAVDAIVDAYRQGLEIGELKVQNEIKKTLGLENLYEKRRFY